MADAFAEKGMRLVLADIDANGLERVAERFHAKGTAMLPIVLDVTDRVAFAEAVRRVEAFGTLHVVCANAGIPATRVPLAELDPADWDRVIAINLTGIFNTVHYLTPLLRAHGEGGHIVITASMAGVIAPSPIGNYTVSKYGVVGLGETLAVELAPANIGVTILMPGTVATALITNGKMGAAMSLGMNPAYVGRRVVKAIENGELHVFTHGDYRPLVAARCEALLAAFGESAQPGFKESEEVLRIMSNTAYPPGSVSRKLRA